MSFDPCDKQEHCDYFAACLPCEVENLRADCIALRDLLRRVERQWTQPGESDYSGALLKEIKERL